MTLMKPYITLLIFTLGMISQSSAQQIPMVNQYFYTPFIYNPAFSGASGTTNAFLVHRSQWTGIPDAPITNAFNIEGSLMNKKAGFGLSMYQDRSGILNEVGGFGSYSYRLKINEEHHILLGVGLGVVNKRVDFDKIIVKDPNDTYLLQQAQSKSVFDGNFGVAYNWNKLNIGVSLQQLMASRFNYENDNDVSMYLRLTRHMLASARYDFDLGESEVVLSPMFLLRYAPGTPIQYEGTVFASYKDFIGLGISYKSDYAVSINAMIKPHSKLTVGYSYDLLINNLQAFAKTSHEFTLGYTFGSKQENNRLRNLQLQVDTLQMKALEADDNINDQGVRIGINEIEIESIKGDLEESKSTNEILNRELDSLKLSGENGGDPSIKADSTRTGLATDYSDTNGNPLQPGNYVVVGVFSNQNNADKYKAKLNSSIVILNKHTTLHYVYTYYDKDFDPILPKLAEARANIDGESWVLKLR